MDEEERTHNLNFWMFMIVSLNYFYDGNIFKMFCFPFAFAFFKVIVMYLKAKAVAFKVLHKLEGCIK